MFDQKIVSKIKEELISNEETLAVAESVTSGFLQAAFSSAEMASSFFHGGITVYNIGQKYRHLFVDPIHALSCNCVSERVSEEMALHVCDLFNSNWGIAITGYASPMPQAHNRLYAYYAIAYNGKIVFKGMMNADNQEPGIDTQLYYVRSLLNIFETNSRKKMDCK